jgi:glycosyltransferase involved in cell wall biosynthesis
MARQMVKMGHAVVIAGLYSPGFGGEDEFWDEGVKVYRFRWTLDGKWFEKKHSLPVRIINRLLKDTGLMQHDIKKSLSVFGNKLEEIIARYKIDLVEMPEYNDYIRFCTSYIPFPKLQVPVVVKLHGSITYTRQVTKLPPAHIIKMEQNILKQAAAVVGVSRYMARQSAKYLSYSKPVEVVYNGIDTNIAIAGVVRNAKQVIYAGTLVASKGIYQLAKAWNLVNKEVPAARLVICGRGDQKKVISYLSTQAERTVTFTGHIVKENLFNYLSSSAISVFPSYSEAFALAPLEAMACGTAVINTNSTSGPELIDHNADGLLVDPDDVEQIASSIIYLLNNPEVCKTLAEKGNKKVKAQFDIEAIARKTIELYTRLLDHD